MQTLFKSPPQHGNKTSEVEISVMFHSPAGLPAGWCLFLWWRSTKPAGRSSAGPEPRRGAQPGPKCSAAAQWRTWSTRRNIAPRIKNTHTHTHARAWDTFNCKIKVFLEWLHTIKLVYNKISNKIKEFSHPTSGCSVYKQAELRLTSVWLITLPIELLFSVFLLLWIITLTINTEGTFTWKWGSTPHRLRGPLQSAQGDSKPLNSSVQTRFMNKTMNSHTWTNTLSVVPKSSVWCSADLPSVLNRHRVWGEWEIFHVT